MSSINLNIGNSGYYQLNGSASNTNQSTTSAASIASSILNNTGSSTGSIFSDAYTLDLSPAAQQYLASGGSAAASSPLSTTGQNFLLSSSQRQEVTDILAKFKDAPFTQDTFNQIQDALDAAGLSSQKLSMIDKATSFNPTQILVDALTGKSSGTPFTADSDDSAQKTKSSNFMQQIISQWKSISSTANAPASDSDTAADAVSAAGGASAG